MDLSIIIVNWNTRELLRACLQSLERCPVRVDRVSEVIVIDNGSTDGSAEMVVEDFPRVRLIANQTNTGFVHANNQGLEWARGDYVLLLNSDTEVQAGSLDCLLDFAAATPRAGIVGPRLVNPDGSHQYSVRRFPGLWDQLVILTKLHNFFPQLIAGYLQERRDWSQPQLVDQVMGACFLIRRAVIGQIGGLDSRFWSWFEEVDYCRRAVAAGWQVWYTPAATVMHWKAQSFNQHLPVAKQRMLIRSLLYYFRKHHGWLAAALLAPFALGSVVLAWGVQLFGIRKKNHQL